MIRQALRWPRDEIGAYARGFQLSLFVGFPQAFGIGWRYDSYPSEWNFELMLGPVSVHVWRPLP